MPQNFKTTFIPQGPPAGSAQAPTPAATSKVRVRQTVSILTVVAALCVVAAGVSIAGVFIFKQSLEQRIVQMESQLETAEKQFEPSLITTLKELDERLIQSSNVLRSHRVVAPFFSALNELTLKNVQYDGLTLEVNEEDGIASVEIEGQARSYQVIAQQSKKLSENRLIQDHIFSEFELQDTGRVRFALLITLSEDEMSFEKSLQNNVQSAVPIVDAAATTNTSVPPAAETNIFISS